MPLVYCGLFGVYARDLFLLSGENFFTTYLFLFTYMYTNIEKYSQGTTGFKELARS